MNEDGLTRLPAGRHGLSPDVVAANQRDRLIDAFARTVAEKGFQATTVQDITSLASVSRNVFYELFGGKDECYIAAYELIRDHIRGIIEEAAAHYDDGPEQLLASLLALLRYYAAEPALGRLCLIEPLGAGPAMVAHHEEAIGVLVSKLSKLLSTGKEPDRADEVLILGAISLISRRINLGEAERLEELLPELAQILLGSQFDAKRIERMVARVSESERVAEAD